MTVGGRHTEELDLPVARRRMLRANLGERLGPGDRADLAERIELTDELARLDDRIAEVTRRLREPAPDALLAAGMRVRLRYADGDEETLRVGDAAEAVRDDGESVLTADSPLGVALVGRRPGDRITYRTPDGTASAEVLAVERPASDHAHHDSTTP